MSPSEYINTVESNISESIEAFDNDFLDSLKAINEESVEDDFLSAMDIIVDNASDMSNFENDLFDPIEKVHDSPLESILEVDETASSPHLSSSTINYEPEKLFKRPKCNVKSVPAPHKDLGLNSNFNESKNITQTVIPQPEITSNEEVTQNYRDFSEVSDEEANIKNKHTDMRGRTQKTFQMKLHTIIERSEIDGYSHIISWSKNGRSFRIHNQYLFLEKVLRRFFFQTVLSSFMRQLGMYGFHKIVGKDNPDRGNFFHELFLRGRPGLCKAMARQGKRKRKIFDVKSEPNLSLYKSMPKTDLTEHVKESASPVSSSNYPKEIRYAASAARVQGPYVDRTQPNVWPTARSLECLNISYIPVMDKSNPYISVYNHNGLLSASQTHYPQLVSAPVLQSYTNLIQNNTTKQQVSQYSLPSVMIRDFPPFTS